jgi:hypothetical protein
MAMEETFQEMFELSAVSEDPSRRFKPVSRRKYQNYPKSDEELDRWQKP